MSGVVMLGDSLVRLPSARIAREDVAAVRDAADLLAQARRIREETQAAHDEARALGYAEGRAAARAELAQALGELTAAFSAANARRADTVAAAAVVVVEQLIGVREPGEIVVRLAAQALRSAGAGDDVRIVEVHPDLLEPVENHFRTEHPEVRIETNPALGTLGCRVMAGDSQIIADLDVQLATLRARWGVGEEGEAER